MHAPDDDYLTAKEAATLLRVAPGTVRRWIRAGEVPACDLGPRRVALIRTDVTRLITPIRSPRALDADATSTTRRSAEGAAADASVEDEDMGAMAILEQIRRENARQRDQFKARQRAPREKQAAAVADARRLSDAILARRGGKPYPPSWQIINQMRDERTRQMAGE